MLLSYKTRHGNTFTFSFERQADRSIACCILRMPPSIPRNASLYETHREYKEGRYFIDPPYPPRSIEEAKSIAGHWAESIEQYGQGHPVQKSKDTWIIATFTRAYQSILEFLRKGKGHIC